MTKVEHEAPAVDPIPFQGRDTIPPMRTAFQTTSSASLVHSAAQLVGTALVVVIIIFELLRRRAT